MMDMTERESGLVVPAVKPEPVEVFQGHPLEIQNEERRERAKVVLEELWDVMCLSSDGGICLPGEAKAKYEAYWQAYHFVGELLLGRECPEREELT